MIRLASVVILSIGIIGLGPKDWWLCDLLANLRLQVLATLIVLLPLLILVQEKLNAVVVTIVIACNAVSVWNLLETTAASPTHGSALRILSYNVGHDAFLQPNLEDYLLTEKPSLVIFQEYGVSADERLSKLRRHYPFSIKEIREDAFGIALYSSVPFAASEIHYFPGTGLPYIQVSVQFGEQIIDVIGTHLRWPMTPTSFMERNEQMQILASKLAAAHRPVVACGDWNLTPWSRWFSHVHDHRQINHDFDGLWHPSWPTSFGWLGISIDHCLTSESLRIVSRRSGPDLGSDHLPIIFDAKAVESPRQP